MAGFREPCPCCGRRNSRDDGKHLRRWPSFPNSQTTMPTQFLPSISAPVRIVGNCGPCQICTEGAPSPPPLGFFPSPPLPSPSNGCFTIEGHTTTPSSETPPVAVPSKGEPETAQEKMVEKANAKEQVDHEEEKGGMLPEKEGRAKWSGGGRREKGGKQNLQEDRGVEVSILVTCECGSKIEIATGHG